MFNKQPHGQIVNTETEWKKHENRPITKIVVGIFYRQFSS